MCHIDRYKWQGASWNPQKGSRKQKVLMRERAVLKDELPTDPKGHVYELECRQERIPDLHGLSTKESIEIAHGIMLRYKKVRSKNKPGN